MASWSVRRVHGDAAQAANFNDKVLSAVKKRLQRYFVFLGTVLAALSGVVFDGVRGEAAAVSALEKQGNAAPVITEGDVVSVTMSEDGEPTAFALTLNATDADSDPLTWSIASQASNGVASVTGNDTSAEVDYVPAPNFNGTDSFGVLVEDGNGGTDLILVNVTITPEPDPPVLVPIGDRSVAEGETLLFAVVATDPDGDRAVLSVENLPPGAAFDPATGVFAWTPGFDDAGVYGGIVFTATDGADPAVMVSETIRITVTDTNRPPILETVGNVEVREERTLTITLMGSDPDGDNLTFFMEMLPAGATFDAETATLTYTPALGAAGDYAVLAGVRDDGTPVQSDTEAFVISVTPLNPGAAFEAFAQALLENFAVGDADADGLLSLEEARALVPELPETRFEGMDTNSDGFLSERELLPFATITENALAGAAQSLLNGFANGDSDGDGRLSEIEAGAIVRALTADQFEALDGDGDGFLTEAELSAVATERAVRVKRLARELAAAFRELDSDGDGALSRAEVEAAIADLAFADFHDLDSDGDGLLSEEELTAAATAGDADLKEAAALIDEFFFEADRNGDGFVSLEEARFGIPSLTFREFQDLDTDGDGLLSREEVAAAATAGNAELEAAAAMLADNFRDGDGDGDGFLSRAEAETLVPDLTLQQFQALDSNGDGLLSEEEVNAAVPPEPVPLAPVIVEGVTAGGLTPTSALLTWKTQVPSVATVRYGTSAMALDETARADTPGGEHQVGLGDLMPGQTYFARVDSAHAADPALTGTGRIFSFTLPRAADTAPPVFVLTPAAAGVAHNALFLTWTTDEFAYGEVLVNGGGVNRTRETAFAAREQAIVLDDLMPDTDYELFVMARDTSGNESSVSMSVRTLARPDYAPARIVDGVIMSELTDTSVSLRWATDRPATTEVAFSEDNSLSITQSLPGLRTSHHITVTNLTPGTAYRVEPRSSDWLGNGTARGNTISVAAKPSAAAAAPVFTAAPRVIGLTDTTATIYWETDQPSDSLVQYSRAGGPTQSAGLARHVLAHQITLLGLSPDTSYRFSCTSTNLRGQGRTAVSEAGPGEVTGVGLVFTTDAGPDVDPPRIVEGPDVVAITDEGFTLRWVTDELADSFVRFGESDSVGRREFQDNALATEHLITLRGLLPETEYQIAVSSADVAGNGPVTAAPMNVTTVATSDRTGPQITTGPELVGLFSTAAVLQWSTSELSSADVTLRSGSAAVEAVYGTARFGTAQTLALTGLAPGTTYAFTLRALDQNQNETLSTGQFTTAAAALSVSPRRVILPVGGTQQLDVTSEDPEERAFQFASQNQSIATVSPAGLITAVAPGRVDILVADLSGERVLAVPTTVIAVPEDEDLTGFFYLLAIFLLQDGESGIRSPCFIATAAAGTPLSPEIDVLRRFRDEALLSNGLGTMMVDAYYRASPPVADWVAQSPTLALLVRILLLPVITLAALWMQSPLLAIGLAALSCWAIARVRRRHRRAAT